ncbi:MAG: haloacid dehalogenase type II [Pseudonocardiaceae bacterium]
MPSTPSVIVFDVNETLSDMSPLGERFADVGAPERLAKLWFAALLRDGFALTAAGASERFATLAATGLRGMLEGLSLNRDLDEAVRHIMEGFSHLSVHPDVPDGIHALREAGLRLATLSNGATQVADRLLGTAGLRSAFERLLSVEDAGVWKPAAAAYEYAARACDTSLTDMLLVAVHPWDIDGAARTGMRTAWIDRTGARYPDYFTPPTHTVTTLGQLAYRLPG